MEHNEQHDDSLEAFFRKNLSNKKKANSNELWETPSDKVWENVRKKLQEQKKQPIFWFWWLKYGAFAVVALCCVVLSYQIFDDKQTIGTLKQQVSQHEKDIEVLKNEQRKNKEASQYLKEKEIQFKDISTANNDYENKNNVLQNDTLIGDNKKQTTESVTISNTSLSTKKQPNKKEKDGIKNDIYKTPNQTFSSKKRSEKEDNVISSKEIYDVNNALNRSLRKSEHKGFEGNETNKFSSSNLKQPINNLLDISLGDMPVISNSNLLAAENQIAANEQQNTIGVSNILVAPLPSLSAGLLEQNLIHENQKKKRPKKRKKTKGHQQFHFGVFVGVNNTYRRLISDNDMEVRLKNIEKAQVTPEFGLRFSYLLGKNKRFFLETGASFSQFALKSEHQLALAYDTDLVTNSSMFYKPDMSSCLGDTKADINLRTKENMPDEMQDGDMMDWNLNTKQTVSFISVPLTLRYRFWQAEKVHFSVAAGLMSNFMIDHKIKALDSQTEGYHLYLSSVSLKSEAMLNPVSLAALLNVNVAFQLKNRLEVWLEPNMSYGFTHIFKDDMMKTYPHTIGFQAGINYHFLKDRKRIIFKCW
ncbi:MAG: outer membrane beta-barrel protein [Chitinophagales bacterium]